MTDPETRNEREPLPGDDDPPPASLDEVDVRDLLRGALRPHPAPWPPASSAASSTASAPAREASSTATAGAPPEPPAPPTS